MRRDAVADRDNKEELDATVLVAQVTVHLDGGQSFELLPFQDTQDVKSKVEELVGDWAKSGFLMRGSAIVPWHRVTRIEATQVDELPRGDAEQRMKEWEARETERMQQSFWKTKTARGKKKDEKDGEKEPPDGPPVH
jgi:biopolymer transport protein ExbB/TolQ